MFAQVLHEIARWHLQPIRQSEFKENAMNAQLTTIPASSLAQTTIRVARVPNYGPPSVVSLGTAPRQPLLPGTIRIAVEATTVTAGDARIRAARVPRGFGFVLKLAFGWSGPRQSILGTELTGIVTEVGDGVTNFGVGDAVIAVTGAKLGAHAEEVVLRANGLIVRRPKGLDIRAAAAIAFGGLTASHYLEQCAVKAGERVLVVGASGAVGLALVQSTLGGGPRGAPAVPFEVAIELH
jgi:NADPH:quinone reductase-like Zn-dependent oxidoreductase